MSLFGALVRTTVNLATLPVDLVKDTVTAFGDACEMTSQDVGGRTKKKLEKLKEEAESDDK